MKYKIITVNSNETESRQMGPQALNKLEILVNEEIGKGWRPIGGIAYHMAFLVSQALIKRQ